MKNRLFQKTLLDIDTKIIEGRGTEAKVSIVMHLKEVKVMLDKIKRIKGLIEQHENFLKNVLNDLESTPSVSKGAKDVPFNKKALYRKVNPNMLAASAAAVNIETLVNEIKNN